MAATALLPVIVLEILFGILVGTSGFAWLVPNPALDTLGLLGFAMLMFVSGIEIDLKLLAGNAGDPAGPRRPLTWSLGVVVASVALSLAGAALIWGGRGLWPN